MRKDTVNSPFIPTQNPPKRKLREAIIPDFIAKHSLTVVASEPGVGKSHLMVDVAATVSQAMPVLIVVPEAEDEFWEALDAWRDYYQQETPSLKALIYPLNLLDSKMLTAFIKHAKPESFGLICIDGLSYCLVGESDADTKTMATACDALYTMIRELGSGIFVNHHTGWNTARERGSIRLRQSARVVAMLSRSGNLLTLKCEKTNRRRFPDRLMEFKAHGQGVVLVSPSNPDVIPSLTDLQQQIVNTLQLDSVNPPASPRKIHEASGMPLSTIYKTIGQLEQDGYIIQSATRTKAYSLTDVGEGVATVTPAGTPKVELQEDQNTKFLWRVSPLESVRSQFSTRFPQQTRMLENPVENNFQEVL